MWDSNVNQISQYTALGDEDSPYKWELSERENPSLGGICNGPTMLMSGPTHSFIQEGGRAPAQGKHVVTHKQYASVWFCNKHQVMGECCEFKIWASYDSSSFVMYLPMWCHSTVVEYS